MKKIPLLFLLILFSCDKPDHLVIYKKEHINFKTDTQKDLPINICRYYYFYGSSGHAFTDSCSKYNVGDKLIFQK